MADVLDHLTLSLMIPANSAQGGWISIRVPQQAKAGKYTGTVIVKDGDVTLSELKLTVHVKEPYSSCPFRMGFPSGLVAESIRRGALLWCGTVQRGTLRLDAPLMKLYADAGGKVITTSIMHKPWNGQTYDAFEVW